MFGEGFGTTFEIIDVSQIFKCQNFLNHSCWEGNMCVTCDITCDILVVFVKLHNFSPVKNSHKNDEEALSGHYCKNLCYTFSY